MIRSILAAVYSCIVRLRLNLYASGLKKTGKLDTPVISIGNITLGGTGKTPFTIYICRLLQGEGFRPAVLSRGYRGTAEKRNLLVSNGKEAFCSAEESGDEPRLMADNLPGVPVAVGGRRQDSARLCLADPSLDPDLFILDDGFQHIQLQRDINIVLVDATSPFGGERVIPDGILREPLSSLKRADAFVVTRAHQAEEALEMIASRLKEYNPSAPVFFFSHRLADFRIVRETASGSDNAERPGHSPPGTKAFVLAAIGNPLQFIKDLENLGLQISGRVLMRDHHPFSQHELDLTMEEFRESGAEFIITTEKDAIRLKNLDLRGMPLYSVGLETYSSEEARFREWVLPLLPAPSSR